MKPVLSERLSRYSISCGSKRTLLVFFFVECFVGNLTFGEAGCLPLASPACHLIIFLRSGATPMPSFSDSFSSIVSMCLGAFMFIGILRSVAVVITIMNLQYFYLAV